ncbi:unnamed protein product [Polarella glacialis]|uniref:Uncharacterized protein n=1 Tax=Polarella glacialis TaxID=89957 RepID=A0A813JB37_POLGL|nr:unnamed protein product [Polarella glacialis]
MASSDEEEEEKPKPGFRASTPAESVVDAGFMKPPIALKRPPSAKTRRDPPAVVSGIQFGIPAGTSQSRGGTPAPARELDRPDARESLTSLGPVDSLQGRGRSKSPLPVQSPAGKGLQSLGTSGSRSGQQPVRGQQLDRPDSMASLGSLGPVDTLRGRSRSPGPFETARNELGTMRPSHSRGGSPLPNHGLDHPGSMESSSKLGPVGSLRGRSKSPLPSDDPLGGPGSRYSEASLSRGGSPAAGRQLDRPDSMASLGQGGSWRDRTHSPVPVEDDSFPSTAGLRSNSHGRSQSPFAFDDRMAREDLGPLGPPSGRFGAPALGSLDTSSAALRGRAGSNDSASKKQQPVALDRSPPGFHNGEQDMMISKPVSLARAARPGSAMTRPGSAGRPLDLQSQQLSGSRPTSAVSWSRREEFLAPEVSRQLSDDSDEDLFAADGAPNKKEKHKKHKKEKKHKKSKKVEHSQNQEHQEDSPRELNQSASVNSLSAPAFVGGGELPGELGDASILPPAASRENSQDSHADANQREKKQKKDKKHHKHHKDKKDSGQETTARTETPADEREDAHSQRSPLLRRLETEAGEVQNSAGVQPPSPPPDRSAAAQAVPAPRAARPQSASANRANGRPQSASANRAGESKPESAKAAGGASPVSKSVHGRARVLRFFLNFQQLMLTICWENRGADVHQVTQIKFLPEELADGQRLQGLGRKLLREHSFLTERHRRQLEHLLRQLAASTLPTYQVLRDGAAVASIPGQGAEGNKPALHLPANTLFLAVERVRCGDGYWWLRLAGGGGWTREVAARPASANPDAGDSPLLVAEQCNPTADEAQKWFGRAQEFTFTDPRSSELLVRNARLVAAQASRASQYRDADTRGATRAMQ